MLKAKDKKLILLIRADASIDGGTGHVMRCLALAQGCKALGGQVEFFLAKSTASLDRRLETGGFAIQRADVTPGSSADAAETLARARAIGASWIVADGYQFGSAWQKQIKEEEISLLLLDDYGHATHYYADIVLNQNLHSDEQPYLSREPYTHLLLGTRFTLLRDEFLRLQSWRRQVSPLARKVLVTLGGSDPANVTGDVIELLSMVKAAEIIVVVGGSNPHLDLLRRRVADSSYPLEIVADAHNMPDLMQWADVAIAAGGTTSWELAFAGLPSLIITLADNQAGISDALDRAGLGISLGKWGSEAKRRLATELPQLMADPRRRDRISRNGRQLVDGLGRERVLKTLVECSTRNARLRGVCS